MEPFIKMDNINFSYRTKYETVELYKNFSLDISKNEYFVVVGQSGCGKSTLLNMIAGLITPQEGQIFVEHQQITNLSSKELYEYRTNRLGYIFQSFHLIYQFTVLENVMAPLLIAGEKKKNAADHAWTLLKRVGLENKKHQYPSRLSGGEQQRVAIARALANNPSILLADEPTGNLDSVTGNLILDLLDEIHKDGKTIVLVTHDLNIKKRATKILDMGKSN